MKKKLLLPILILFILLLSLKMTGQQTIDASGQNATGSGGSVSYSVGQIVYTTNTSTLNGSVAQGVQQPYEISVVLGLENPPGINLEMIVAPNPTTDFVMLKINNYDFESLTYQLYDLNGKLFLTGQATTDETRISIGNFPSTVYFLKISNGNKAIKTFKIIKN